MEVRLYSSFAPITLSDRQYPSVVSSVDYRLWEILLGNKGAIDVGLKNLFRENTATTTLADLNARSCGFVCTPLIYAILCDYTEIASILIDNGADVDICDSGGMTPIMHAVRYEFEDGIKLLISRGADPDLESVLQDISDSNLGMELSLESREKIRTAFDVGKAMSNQRIKQTQLEITKQSKLIPVLARIVSEYCLLR